MQIMENIIWFGKNRGRLAREGLEEILKPDSRDLKRGMYVAGMAAVGVPVYLITNDPAAVSAAAGFGGLMGSFVYDDVKEEYKKNAVS